MAKRQKRHFALQTRQRMDHRQSDVDVIENATQRLIWVGAAGGRAGGGISGLPFCGKQIARRPPLLMNYNPFNGGGAGELSQGDGRNLQRCQDIFMQSESRGTPEMTVRFIKKRKKPAKTVKQT